MVGVSTVRGVRDRTLDRLAVAFGRALRMHGVEASPAEVIEVRRVMAIVGARDLAVLAAGLRSVCVKYAYESDAFERVFWLFFANAAGRAGEQEMPRPRGVAAELPAELRWDEDFTGAARMIGADEHTDEIGDWMIDDPDAGERHAESAHREENDFSVSSGTDRLDVDVDGGSVAGGVTYTVEVDKADSGEVGELVGASTRVRGTPIGITDAAGILRALDACDARYAYGPDGAEGLDERGLAELESALSAFIDALSARLESLPIRDHADDPDQRVASDQADIDRACHRLVARLRGAPRRSVGRFDRGALDIRHTMRASVATDGVPIALWRRRSRPGPVRLLVVVDVSLSVRPVTGFVLRLAQTLHRLGDRCEVVAFVDRPVLVTTTLRTAHADRALAAVLSADGLDLAATSDYGQLFAGLLGDFGDLLTRRTSVLMVGDARSNGFDPRLDLMAELSRRTHRVAWVTPEPSRYWSQTGCALSAYAQFCGGVVSARDGAEMVGRCDELGAALG
ncbi:VWA domain-containing protein [Gordonia sp. LSe1-13]|uniref:VWA domain-containing protein n=1 Tax=Gordonia sesuvii TaxID=3116777 RepID=A0ABU7M7F1_9ACTN|nr:VWA domain-containing protein [Gordonia sp. LSe1-13]